MLSIQRGRALHVPRAVVVLVPAVLFVLEHLMSGANLISLSV